MSQGGSKLEQLLPLAILFILSGLAAYGTDCNNAFHFSSTNIYFPTSCFCVFEFCAFEFCVFVYLNFVYYLRLVLQARWLFCKTLASFRQVVPLPATKKTNTRFHTQETVT